MDDLIERDAVIWITAETGALETQRRVKDLPAVNRWISVEDALPEVWKEVLVVLNSNGYQLVRIGEMQESGDWMVSGEFWYDKGDPELTHWMPLPSTEGLT